MSVLKAPSAVWKGLSAIPRKVFGTRNERLLKGYRRHVGPTGEWEPTVRGDYDGRYTARLAELRMDEIPPEQREPALAGLRRELSQDLLDRSRVLREQTEKIMQPLLDWWRGLDPVRRMESYYRDEYRRRNARLIQELDRAGLTAEAFAVLREASRRAQNHRHFDCQLIGGRVLFEGKIAEMKTGEGKTIVCHLAAYVNVLCGRKVHIITVNDYLVKRDAEFAAPIFELVGVTVGHIQAMLDPGGREGIRRNAYLCDITYGTNSEFGFDYLRDNMKSRLQEQVQGPLDFVIVDEVDSILIDEARTPLIISGPAYDDVTRYPRANKVAEELVRRQAVWDRKVLGTVARFDGEDHKIPKLVDAMKILGYREKKRNGADKPKRPADESPEVTAGDSNDAADDPAALGPDFLTDDQVEALQVYENEILKLPAPEQYRRYFIVQTERKQVGLTHEGVTIAQELLDIGSLYSGDNMEWPHLIENALRSFKVYHRDRDYVVQNGQIIIVDPFTGRLMYGRQWSDGLHQAVEAKERVSVKEETQTLATITIQNFVKLYLLRAGMTGTAMTEATEFDKIYKLDVVEIPTNRPVNRADSNDKMYRDTDQKYDAIVEEIHEMHSRGRPADPFLLADILAALKPVLQRQGRETVRVDEAIRQFNNAELNDPKVIRFMLEVYDETMGDLVRGKPILVGTTSVENSERLSKLLTSRYGIEHEVLNAKNHAREADIVAKAGYCSLPAKGGDKTPLGNVTIATNMAGRGTDIKLGPGVVYPTCKVPVKLPEGARHSTLFPVGVTKCCIHCDEYDPATNCAHCWKPKIDPRFPELGRKVCSLAVPCGLHIIGTERHEARRIDNQLRGRSGRQGDPGSSRFSFSLQDDLLKLFMPDWMLRMLDRLGFTEGTSLEDKRLTKGIERAQRKVEERNFSTRKHLLEWDEPMDFQRKEFYAARQRILEERDLPGLIFDAIQNAIRSTVTQYLAENYQRVCIAEWCRTQFELTVEEETIDAGDLEAARTSIREKAKEEALEQIRTSLGEYIDPEEPPSQWDLGGLAQWARRAFKLSLSQNQLRKMSPEEIEEALTTAAVEHFGSLNLDGIAIFLTDNYALSALADWAKVKFNVAVTLNDVKETPRDEITELILSRVRESYRRREISYPLEWCLERAFSAEGSDHAATAQLVVDWANWKYNLGWTLENVQGKSVKEVHDALLQLSEDFFDGRLQREIDDHIHDKEREELVAWAKLRFGRAWNQGRFDRWPGDLRSAILAQGREMLRWELTRLEQFVLLRLYDQAWKDHLLEMDHLKTAIMQRPLGGDQTHPQSQFAIEGRELFTQMWTRIANRVTEIIFKVKIAPGATDDEGSGEGRAVAGSPRSGAPLAFSHADATGAGFSAASRDQQAAMQAQNVETKVETIRREQPKVGRNDPCPCGSGKKYKQCHGRGS